MEDEMINFEKYFLPEHTFYLNHIRYDIKQLTNTVVNANLVCKDEITASYIEDQKVRVIFTRSVSFNPNILYEVSVSFGALFSINPILLREFKLLKIDLTEEFIAVSDKMLTNLISRTSLQISQITSSYGQQPLITSPNYNKQLNV